MRSNPRRILTAATVLLGLTAGSATIAEAYRGPTSHERSAISRAVKHSKLTSAFPDSAYKVTRIRVSTAGPYASGRISGRGVPPATAVVRRSHGVWKLKTVGTAELGCGLPSAVRRDLRLDCH